MVLSSHQFNHDTEANLLIQASSSLNLPKAEWNKQSVMPIVKTIDLVIPESKEVRTLLWQDTQFNTDKEVTGWLYKSKDTNLLILNR